MPRAVGTDVIELEYDERGQGIPLLLVSGLGGQLVDWPDGFLDILDGLGFRVIRFDNRDVGLSSRVDTADAPDLPAAYRELAAGRPVSAPYLLSDMANDAIAVLDALEIAAAHVLGVSMGGMIAQTMAIDHPNRVLSLISIMSTTGNRAVGGATPAAAAILIEPQSTDRAVAIEQAVTAEAVMGGPFTPRDPAAIAEQTARSFDRSPAGPGVTRQLIAILASGDRTPALSAVSAPSLVIHGDADPLIDISGGRATAAAIPGARFTSVAGMGHALRPDVWQPVAELIAEHLRSVAAERPVAPADPDQVAGQGVIAASGPPGGPSTWAGSPGAS